MITLADIRHGVRALLRTPGFTVVALATLALGIGATTMVYSFVAAIFASSSPPSALDREVGLWTYQRSQGAQKGVVSSREFVEWRRRAQAFDRVGAFRRVAFNLGGIDRAVRVSGEMASADLLDVLEYRVAIGRPVAADDERAGAPPVVWLGHRFWVERFAGSADVVGRTVALDGEPTTVAGVLAPRPLQPDVLVPLRLDPADRAFDSRSLFVFARLREGVSLEQARAEMVNVGAALEREFPETHRGWAVNTRPLAEEFIGRNARIVFGMLLGAVTAVLLIGCANIANLLIARGLGRQRDLAIRSALGATRGRLFRHALVESGLLAIAGGALGAMLAYAGLRWLQAALPGATEAVASVPIGPRVLLFAICFSGLATLGFGLVPAVQGTRPDLDALLREGSPRATGGRRWPAWRMALVGGEVFLSVTLLVLAALLVRTLIALQRIEPGFDARGVLTARVTLPASQYATDDAVAGFYERVVADIGTRPAVVHASAASRVPVAGSRYNPNRSLIAEGRPADRDESLLAVDLTVMPGYFGTLGIAVEEGREFDSRDRAGAPLVALVSRAAARQYWAGRNPIGARLRLGDEPEPLQWRTVVGVVADVRNDDIDAPPLPHVYVPLAQRPERTLTIVARAAGDAAALTPVLRAAVAAADADVPLYDVATLERIVWEDLADTRVLVQVLTLFSASALLLAVVGIGGVLAQTVSQRVPEIGLRMALGATAAEVVTLVLRQTIASVLGGLVVGLVASAALARLISSVLYGVSPTDPRTYLLVIGTTAGAAVLAAVVPILRAVRVDPLSALRA